MSEDMRNLRLNVFRLDAATVAARIRGIFASEGLEVAITQTPNSTEQMSGKLNLAGLQTVLDLRTEFCFKLHKGETLAAYYDESYFSAAASK